ncbi:hypothetical protein TRAPUB_7277 [Trametes pubescens]|uniref:Epidermal growth factor receptor-like transmembrane-juxtamembrane segment domain-containing protein n=1 Tax=Trametes pubescens TaxID=154538 RepID=A0A1M2V3J2_TRAPU|nr:hypothetical protein TRAPUB_7277 [Trametes pubescens]
MPAGMRNARRSSNRFVSIDAQDSEILYDSTWKDSKISTEPVKSTLSPHGNSTATYTFHGIAIYLYGYIGPVAPPEPNIICYVDETLVPPTPARLVGSEDDIKLWASRPLCWQDQLTDGNHTFKLVVDSATEAYPFMLDELQFRISSQQYENLAGNLEANVTVSGSSSATSASSTSSASATATAATSSDSRGTSVAPIVGGVVGAVLGIALMALGIYFVVRRRKQAYSKLVDADMHQSEADRIVPFTGPGRRPSARTATSSTAVEDSETTFEGQGASTVAATYNPSPAPSTESTSTLPQVRKSVTVGLLSALGRARQRTDPESTMSEVPSEAPPMYSPGPSTR